MTPLTARWMQVFISSLINGALGAVGVMVAALSEGRPASRVTISLACLTGVALMLKDLQSSMRQPPGQ